MRLLSAILSCSGGEGQVPSAASSRATAAFIKSGHFTNVQGHGLVQKWFATAQILTLLASPLMRTAFDCAPTRFRAQFLCLLNRVAIAEAAQKNGCVRSEWQDVMR